MPTRTASSASSFQALAAGAAPSGDERGADEGGDEQQLQQLPVASAAPPQLSLELLAARLADMGDILQQVRSSQAAAERRDVLREAGALRADASSAAAADAPEGLPAHRLRLRVPPAHEREHGAPGAEGGVPPAHNRAGNEPDAALLDEDEQEEVSFHLARLYGEETDSSSAAERITKLFGGHELPLAHDPNENVYPRGYGPHARVTGHNRPQAMLDGGSSMLIDELRARAREPGGAHCAAYEYELRTLVPALSYLVDLEGAALHLASQLGVALQDGVLDPSFAPTVKLATDITVQARSTRQHLGERLDILRDVSEGDSAGVEVMAEIYGREAMRSGQMSDLGMAVRERTTALKATKLITAAAAQQAKSLPAASAIMHLNLARANAGGGKGTGTGRPRAGGKGSFRQPGRKRRGTLVVLLLLPCGAARLLLVEGTGPKGTISPLSVKEFSCPEDAMLVGHLASF